MNPKQMFGFDPGDDQSREGLATSSLFAGLEQHVVESIWRKAKLHHCSRGQFFCLQGKPANNLFLLRRGLVKLCGTGRSGKEVLLDWMLPGGVFGIGALLSPPVEYLWSVLAVEDSEALSWDRAEIVSLANLSPRIYENALKIALLWSLQLQGRFEELSDGFAEQRIAHLTLGISDKFKKNSLTLTDEELAEMAGTNVFSVNKILRRWELHGYIQKGRRRLVILARHDLERLASKRDLIAPP